MFSLSTSRFKTLSEMLHYELAEIGTKIKVSVLCYGAVNTPIMDTERNRPIELQNDPTEVKKNPKVDELWQTVGLEVRKGLFPQQVVDEVFNAIRSQKFYIIIPSDEKQAIQKRMEDILQERNPN